MKSNNKLDSQNPTLKHLLNKYPKFMDSNPNSVHSRYNNILAGVLNKLKHDMKILELYRCLYRPLKIWRTIENENTAYINYIVSLDNLKHVKLYKEEKKGEDKLLDENSELKTFKYLVSDFDINRTDKYYIEATTHDGLKFQKGFPENDTPQNNIYDHDKALDNLGKLYGIKRREYYTNLTEEEYPYTNPPYCNSKTEHDYYYEKRIQEYLKDLKKLPLYKREFRKLYSIEPDLKGLWRQIAHMNHDNMDNETNSKYMASKEYGNNTYKLILNLKHIPKNITPPSDEDIALILKRTLPTGVKVIYEKKTKTKKDIKGFLNTQIHIKDHISFSIELKDIIHVKTGNSIDKSVAKEERNAY